jgi:outer membrane protein assembly factor BamB
MKRRNIIAVGAGLPDAQSQSLKRLLSLLFLGIGMAQSFAGSPEQNWPQLRGPLGTGVAPQAEPPISWSETEHVKWKVKLPGSGTSTPIVWDDRIFIQTAIEVKQAVAPVGKDSPESANAGNPPGGMRRPETPKAPFQFVLMSLDRSTGKTLWQKVLREEVPHEGHHANHGYASHSPVTDGQVVASFFGSRGLHCLDMQGNVKWQKDLGKMKTRNAFGEGISPALSGDTIVIGWDHEGDDFIAAFDKTTGKELWRQPRNEATTWATPVIVEYEGKKQVVMSATKKIRAYDLATGAQIWECGGMTDNVIPTPVTEDGLLYAISGFRGAALLAIRLGRTGDLTGTDAIAWSLKKNTPYVPSPLLYEHRLYFFAGNNAVLSCVDAKTGQIFIDAQKIAGMKEAYASPLGAGGRVYLTGRDGVTVVLKRSDLLEVLSTNKLDENIDASPVAVGKSLFLRGRESLYCIE